MKSTHLTPLWKATLLLVLTSLLAACGGAPQQQAGSQPSGEQVKLILGAYTTPREAYQELIPIFQKQWKDKTGQDVVFEESYLGSGAQSRAIIEGFEADIAALSLEADINRIQKEGLITHDWKSGPTKGMVSDSIVSFAVRPGNPQGIQDWADLAKPGLEILTPNPKTSGGAMWNVLALYGAAKRGFVDGVPKDDDAAAQDFLLKVLSNVTVLDKGAREHHQLREGRRRPGHHLRERGAGGAAERSGLRAGHPALDHPDRKPGGSHRRLCR